MKKNIKKYDSYCFIDSTIFLHFKLFTEIEWNNLVNSTSTLLVICPTVMKELDLKKDLAYDINIRHRARKVITKISEILNSKLIGRIKKNLDLEFLLNEPLIDWRKEQLDPEVQDDRIIASILEQKNNFQNIILMSDDTGLKLKATARGITCLSLPKKYRISEKKDKKEIENEQLKNRIAFLENSFPILKLKILDEDEPSNFIKKKLTKYIAPSDKELIERLQVLKSELEYKSPPEIIPGLTGFLVNVSEDELKRYEKDLDDYIKKMHAYFKSETILNDYYSRLIKLRFVILNTGNKPAEDIDIFIKFPDGFEVLSEDELPKKSDEPRKPTPPRSLQDTLQSVKNFSIPELNPIIPYDFNPKINLNLASGPHIKKTNSYNVNYDIPKLKHGLRLELNPLYILFKSIVLSKSFHIKYSILADNLPEASDGTLNIVIYK